MKLKMKVAGVCLVVCLVVVALFVSGEANLRSQSGDIKLFPESGKVGVNDASPADTLVVNGSSPGMRVRTADDGFAAVNLESNGHLWHLSKRKSGAQWDYGEKLILYYYDGSSFNDVIVVAPNGSVGIGQGNPAAALDVDGVVRADDFTTYSPMYEGDDALEQIMGVKCEEGEKEKDGWCEIDHDSLPEGVKVVFKETRLKNKETGELAPLNQTLNETAREEDYEEVEVDVDGESLTRMTKVMLKGMQELREENDQLKTELCKKDDSYKFC